MALADCPVEHFPERVWLVFQSFRGFPRLPVKWKLLMNKILQSRTSRIIFPFICDSDTMLIPIGSAIIQELKLCIIHRGKALRHDSSEVFLNRNGRIRERRLWVLEVQATWEDTKAQVPWRRKGRECS